MKNPLVSIITPCYNGEDFLAGYFKSILEQTYDNLELIFVNDGSTDQTEEIALSYKEKLEDRGIKFTYIFQENQGQAAAVNKGLAIFNGEYLAWPDSDDLMSPDSIEKRVRFLEQNPDFGLVRSNAEFFDYDTKKTICRASELPNRFHTDIFMDLILEETYCFCCYMVRRDAFLKLYPGRQIKVFSAGQNWQILIPLTGNYLCGYIDEDLYHLAVRRGSHSRQKRTYQEQLQRQRDLKEVLLSSIEISGRCDQNYREIVEIKYLHRYFNIAIENHEKQDAKRYYRKLKTLGVNTPSDKRSYLLAFYHGLGDIYDLWLRGCAKIQRTLGKNQK